MFFLLYLFHTDRRNTKHPAFEIIVGTWKQLTSDDIFFKFKMGSHLFFLGISSFKSIVLRERQVALLHSITCINCALSLNNMLYNYRIGPGSFILNHTRLHDTRICERKAEIRTFVNKQGENFV